MFKLNPLHGDDWLRSHLGWLVASPTTKIGKLQNFKTVDELLNALIAASYEKIKHLPRSGLTIYRTSDLGVGYCKTMSLGRVRELVALSKVDQSTRVYLQSFHGNLRAVIKSTDLHPSLLQTDDVYVFYHEPSQKVWNVQIGKPSNPNRLYWHSTMLNGKSGHIHQVATIEGLNRIDFVDPDIDTDLP